MESGRRWSSMRDLIPCCLLFSFAAVQLAADRAREFTGPETSIKSLAALNYCQVPESARLERIFASHPIFPAITRLRDGEFLWSA